MKTRACAGQLIIRSIKLPGRDGSFGFLNFDCRNMRDFVELESQDG